MKKPLAHPATTLLPKAKTELQNILNWWETNLIDHKNGGFIGQIDGFGRPNPLADRGGVLNARILWTFSAAARATGNADWLRTAEHAFDYFKKHFFDKKNGGVFWAISHDEQPTETKKQIYAQAFAIYALAEFYRVSKNETALRLANDLFFLIEKHSRDRERGGYFEAFSADWQPLGDLRLSEKDANEAKTMNTHLHVLEAYATLFRAAPRAEIGDALRGLIDLFLEKFIDPATHRLHLFFDENWVLKSKIGSFGHDIEAAWLLVDAADALADTELLEKTKAVAVRIARATIADGIDPLDGGLWNEIGPDGLTDAAKDWWPQAEAVVGFLDAFGHSGDPFFAEKAAASWLFIEEKIIDRAGGEWFWGIAADGQPDREHDKAGPWKCPYHNGRACLEIMRRLSV